MLQMYLYLHICFLLTLESKEIIQIKTVFESVEKKMLKVTIYNIYLRWIH